MRQSFSCFAFEDHTPLRLLLNDIFNAQNSLDTEYISLNVQKSYVILEWNIICK